MLKNKYLAGEKNTPQRVRFEASHSEKNLMKLRVPLYSLRSLNYRSTQMTCTNDYKLQSPEKYSIKRQKKGWISRAVRVRSTIYHQAHDEASQRFRFPNELTSWEPFTKGSRLLHARFPCDPARATLESGDWRAESSIRFSRQSRV